MAVVKNEVIRFLVTKEQREQIRLRAQVNGYSTISAYLRELAMNTDFLIKFNQLYRKLMEK